MIAQQRAQMAARKAKEKEEAEHAKNPKLAALKELQQAAKEKKLKGLTDRKTPGDKDNGKGGKGKKARTARATGESDKKDDAKEGDTAAAEETEKKEEVKKEEKKEKKKEKKKKQEEEVKELPPDPNPVDQEWTCKMWLHSIDLQVTDRLFRPRVTGPPHVTASRRSCCQPSMPPTLHHSRITDGHLSRAQASGARRERWGVRLHARAVARDGAEAADGREPGGAGGRDLGGHRAAAAPGACQPAVARCRVVSRRQTEARRASVARRCN